MKRIPNMRVRGLRINESQVGETIEQKIRRMTTNGEPVEDVEVPKMYSERKHGVLEQFDVRADKMLIAQQSMNRVTKSYQARDKQKAEQEAEEQEEITGGEPT